MRTRSLAKALSQAHPSADGSAPPVRALRMSIENPRPSTQRDYAYARVSFAVALIAHDGADGESDVYKARLSNGETTWGTWPHAPGRGHGDVAFRFSFDAKDSASRPLAPECHLTAYEPSLDTAKGAVAFAERILTTLRKLDDAQGVPASFPEAVARLMMACECTALATHQKDFAALTNKEPPAWRSNNVYRMASSIPDARMMAEDAESAIRASHAPGPNDREGNDSDARA